METVKSEESKESKKETKPTRSINLSISLSPTTRWILTALILGVGVVLVVVFYAQEQSRNSKLKDDVATAEAILVRNSLTRNDLEDRLVQASLDLAELQIKFVSSQQSMDAEEALYGAAADAGVEIVDISYPTPTSEKLEGTEYSVFLADVSVTGEADQLLRFAGVLGNWLPSSTFELASMSSTDEGISLTLSIKVYTAEIAPKK